MGLENTLSKHYILDKLESLFESTRFAEDVFRNSGYIRQCQALDFGTYLLVAKDAKSKLLGNGDLIDGTNNWIFNSLSSLCFYLCDQNAKDNIVKQVKRLGLYNALRDNEYKSYKINELIREGKIDYYGDFYSVKLVGSKLWKLFKYLDIGTPKLGLCFGKASIELDEETRRRLIIIKETVVEIEEKRREKRKLKMKEISLKRQEKNQK